MKNFNVGKGAKNLANKFKALPKPKKILIGSTTGVASATTIIAPVAAVVTQKDNKPSSGASASMAWVSADGVKADTSKEYFFANGKYFSDKKDAADELGLTIVDVKNPKYTNGQTYVVDLDDFNIKQVNFLREVESLKSENQSFSFDNKEYRYYTTIAGDELSNPGFFIEQPKTKDQVPDLKSMNANTEFWVDNSGRYYSSKEKAIAELISKSKALETVTLPTDKKNSESRILIDDVVYTYFSKTYDNGDSGGFYINPPEDVNATPDAKISDIKFSSEKYNAGWFTSKENALEYFQDNPAISINQRLHNPSNQYPQHGDKEIIDGIEYTFYDKNDDSEDGWYDGKIKAENKDYYRLVDKNDSSKTDWFGDEEAINILKKSGHYDELPIKSVIDEPAPEFYEDQEVVLNGKDTYRYHFEGKPSGWYDRDGNMILPSALKGYDSEVDAQIDANPDFEKSYVFSDKDGKLFTSLEQAALKNGMKVVDTLDSDNLDLPSKIKVNGKEYSLVTTEDPKVTGPVWTDGNTIFSDIFVYKGDVNQSPADVIPVEKDSTDDKYKNAISKDGLAKDVASKNKNMSESELTSLITEILKRKNVKPFTASEIKDITPKQLSDLGMIPDDSIKPGDNQYNNAAIVYVKAKDDPNNHDPVFAFQDEVVKDGKNTKADNPKFYLDGKEITSDPHDNNGKSWWWVDGHWFIASVKDVLVALGVDLNDYSKAKKATDGTYSDGYTTYTCVQASNSMPVKYYLNGKDKIKITSGQKIYFAPDEGSQKTIDETWSTPDAKNAIFNTAELVKKIGLKIVTVEDTSLPHLIDGKAVRLLRGFDNGVGLYKNRPISTLDQDAMEQIMNGDFIDESFLRSDDPVIKYYVNSPELNSYAHPFKIYSSEEEADKDALRVLNNYYDVEYKDLNSIPKTDKVTGLKYDETRPNTSGWFKAKPFDKSAVPDIDFGSVKWSFMGKNFTSDELMLEEIFDKKMSKISKNGEVVINGEKMTYYNPRLQPLDHEGWFISPPTQVDVMPFETNKIKYMLGEKYYTTGEKMLRAAMFKNQKRDPNDQSSFVLDSVKYIYYTNAVGKTPLQHPGYYEQIPTSDDVTPYFAPSIDVYQSGGSFFTKLEDAMKKQGVSKLTSGYWDNQQSKYYEDSYLTETKIPDPTEEAVAIWVDQKEYKSEKEKEEQK